MPKAAPRNEQHKGQNNTKQPQLQAHQSSNNHSSNQQQQPKPAGRTPTLWGKNVNNSHTIRTDLPPTGEKRSKTNTQQPHQQERPPTHRGKKVKTETAAVQDSSKSSISTDPHRDKVVTNEATCRGHKCRTPNQAKAIPENHLKTK
ncbi:hypothetical protein LXL04_014823 [Taraxacum kok-saghyz]